MARLVRATLPDHSTHRSDNAREIMSSYGPPGYPGAGQPDDPAGTPGHSGYPPQGPAYPPGAGYPPPGAQPVSGGGYPDPTTPYPSYPPGGGYPDPGQPAGYPPPTSGGGAYPQPGSGGGAYPPPPGSGGFPPPPPPPGWGPPPPGMPGGQPPKKSRTGLIIGLVVGAVVLLMLCGCGAIVAIGALAEDGGSTASDPTPVPSVDVEPTLDDDPASSAPPSTGDSGLIVVGDCVVNDGTDDDAELRKVACEPGSYEVLARIPLTTDTARCDDPVFGHEETDTTYVFDSDQTILDYVLCMKEL
ncbi:hypothetical protein O7623_19830 [Solwaraspora sp. WMMD791]|uniref:LppU/SCO3897 family protein n=1 Tax=Solwaraspora sp. WMMD791 TaxID=3016086 RepID=UPI00249AB2DD|nr:hypothetical protein [Solwaraspora sp. WMMD791]WFE25623.1 hypothetical protein O7623_19830 [Solwaraspora sp. WMMD791]